MSKYVLQVSYTVDGAKGVVKDGGSKRREAARALVESLGGKLDAFYFAFGETDVFAIVDMPDAASAAAASMAVAASGAAAPRLTPLLTPEEIDTAAKKTPTYTPPGR
jgi:uncharacterized protein with GYD domain